jgi:hypothetical protein
MTCADERLWALWVTITLFGRVRAYPDMASVADTLSETEAVLFGVLRTMGQTEEQEGLAHFAVKGRATAH